MKKGVMPDADDENDTQFVVVSPVSSFLLVVYVLTFFLNCLFFYFRVQLKKGMRGLGKAQFALAL